MPTPLEEGGGREQYVAELTDRLGRAHELLRSQQVEVRQQDDEEPLLFARAVTSHETVESRVTKSQNT